MPLAKLQQVKEVAIAQLTTVNINYKRKVTQPTDSVSVATSTMAQETAETTRAKQQQQQEQLQQ